MLNEFMNYLQQEVDNHSIYVIGGQGQRGKAVTEAWINSREQDKNNAKRAISFWKKQCSLGYQNVLGAFDCSGLGMYWLQNVKGYLKSDLNANGMMGKCTKIAREDVKKGDWLFEVTNNRATHIWFAISNTEAIEARGRDYGVCISTINKRKWNYFGRPVLMANEIKVGTDIITNTIKKFSKGDEVISVQLALISHGYNLPKYGVDGKYGNECITAVKLLQKDNDLPVTGTINESECNLLELSWQGKPIDYKFLYDHLLVRYNKLIG